MPTWETIYSELLHLHGQRLSHALQPWEPELLLLLVISLAYLLLVEDWRLALLAWVSTGIAVGGLLVALLPVPWALSRTIAVALEDALLWMGARRWPHIRRGCCLGLWPRAAIVAITAIAAWQLRPYAHRFWLEPVHADAVLALVAAALLLLTLHGTTFHGTLGLLLLIQAGILVLAPLFIPRAWLYIITPIDVAVAAVGSMALASEGVAVRKRLEEGRRT